MWKRNVVAISSGPALGALFLLMEGIWGPGNLLWGMIFGGWVLFVISLYSPEIWKVIKRLREVTVVRLKNKGFSIGLQNQTRLVLVREWPWIRLVKPVVAQAKPIEVKVSLGSAVLNVRKPPFHRKILYRVRGLLGLSPIPPKEQKGS